jgi:AcrR family transcriptional regulator
MQKKNLTKRDKQAIATHQKIYNTALKLFYKSGYDKVTVDDICEAAGVSKGAFYDHFKSKDQVIIDLFLMADEIYGEYAERELGRQKNITDRLLLLGRRAVKYSNDMGIDIIQVSYRAQINTHKKTASIASEKRALFKLLLKLIEQGQARGEIRTDLSAEDITRIMVRCVRGVIYDWCLVNGRFNLIKEADKAIAILMKGMRPD